MHSLWNDDEVRTHFHSPLLQRVYTSRLLGQEPSLVLHGGGNTSVKIKEKDIFGDDQDVLYVKGSGWDLKTIEPQGFAPVRLTHVQRLAQLEQLSDREMVVQLRSALLNPSAPTPSVEAILHAIIPFTYVDHTHTDAVVTISNTPQGAEKLRLLYGPELLILPYCMPGFDLAKQVYQATKDVPWQKLKGILLLHHGLFTFADSARLAYENMLALVTQAEEYLAKNGAPQRLALGKAQSFDPRAVASLRKQASLAAGRPLIMTLDASEQACGFAQLAEVKEIAGRGPLTPDHVLHTKHLPLVLTGEPSSDLKAYTEAYQDYFLRLHRDHEVCLDPAPRMVIWPEMGVFSLGNTIARANTVKDIYAHTLRAIQWGEALGGWTALDEKDIFAVEYWDLEQAKLKQGKQSPSLEGKVAVVTGAAAGIGLATAKELAKAGACVLGLDINPAISQRLQGPNLLGLCCDCTDTPAIRASLATGIKAFGGIDLLVSNAGIFPLSAPIESLATEVWDRTLEVNLHSHFRVIKECIPFLKEGLEPTLIIVGSKNVLAPGPGASAYSVSKAGLTQLARVAALELAPSGIATHVIHPHAVMDTDLWTPAILEKRAAAYQMTVEQYKKNNLMQVEINSQDIALVISTLAGGVFRKTTGLQIPFDGGNDRVI